MRASLRPVRKTAVALFAVGFCLVAAQSARAQQKDGIVWLEPEPYLEDILPLPPKAIGRLGRNHQMIPVLAFSPDGRFFLTAQAPGLYLWGAATGKPLRLLKGVNKGSMAAAFSPDGSLLASGGADNVLAFWDVKTGKQIDDGHQLPGHAYSISFTLDGKTVVVGSNGILLWNAETKIQQGTLKGHTATYVWKVLVSPDGQRMASISDKEIILWNLPKRQMIATVVTDKDFAGPPGALLIRPDFAFSADSKELIICRKSDGRIKRWKSNDGTPIGGWQKINDNFIWQMEIAPDGKLFARGGQPESGARATILICELVTGKVVSKIALPQKALWYDLPFVYYRFAADGKRLAVWNNDGRLEFWDTATGKLDRTILPTPARVLGMKFTDENKNLVSVTEDNQVLHWDLTKFLQTKRGQLLLGERDASARLAPGGKLLATVSAAGTGKFGVWDLTTATKRWTAAADLASHKGIKPADYPTVGVSKSFEWIEPYLVAFATDGQTVAGLTGEMSVTVWESDTGKVVNTIGTGGRVRSIALPPKGKTLLLGAAVTLEPVREFDLATGKEMAQLPTPKSPSKGPPSEWKAESLVDALVVSPDGKTLAVVELIVETKTGPKPGKYIPGVRRQVRLWDLASKKQLHLVLPEEKKVKVAFSPDSKLLAVNHSLLDLESKKSVFFGNYSDNLRGIVFSDDGSLLATNDALHPTILIWDVAELKKGLKSQ